MNRIIRGTSLGIVGIATFLSIATSQAFNEWSSNNLEERVSLEQGQTQTFCIEAPLPASVSSFQIFASLNPLAEQEADAEADVPAGELLGRMSMRLLDSELEEQVAELRTTSTFIAIGDQLECAEDKCVMKVEMTLESTLAEETIDADLNVGATGIHDPESDTPDVDIEIRAGACDA